MNGAVKYNKIQYALLSTAVICTLAAFTLHHNAVNNLLSEEDKKFIPLYLSGIGSLPKNPTYIDELNLIRSVQRSVLNISPGIVGLPLGQERELKELYEAKSGECYDRSRSIEKILRFLGFKTRHIALYDITQTGSKIKALTTPGTFSHAVTEVLTKHGWLVVDSNTPWVSADQNQQPVSIKYMQSSIEDSTSIAWGIEPTASIYAGPFIFIYGLYSRHGKFYPPYNFIPDIQYGEFIQNIM
jgi:hypothetical protein